LLKNLARRLVMKDEVKLKRELAELEIQIEIIDRQMKHLKNAEEQLSERIDKLERRLDKLMPNTDTYYRAYGEVNALCDRVSSVAREIDDLHYGKNTLKASYKYIKSQLEELKGDSHENEK
jgi:predicted  nucleic acid-binding Zn-ribbon protein